MQENLKIITVEKYCGEVELEKHFKDGCINLVVSATGSGKALKNGTGVLTPTGYKKIETLKIGDPIFGEDGKIYKVKGVFPQGEKRVYNVVFFDKTIIPSSEDHLWSIQTANMRPNGTWKTVTLKEIINNIPLIVPTGEYKRKNVYIPMTAPLQFPEREVPIPPYSLGALLGDGSFKESIIFTNSDEEVVNRIKKELFDCKVEEREKRGDAVSYIIIGEKDPNNRAISLLKQKIRDLKLEGTVSNSKFIPDIYKYNSIEVRLAILQGLIDTDGYCPGSSYEFTTVSKQLAEDVKFLCESLGLTAQLNTKKTSFYHDGKKKEGQLAYRVYIKTSDIIPQIHYSSTKGKKWKRGQTVARRYIKEIQDTGKYAPMTCISTTNPTGLFITEGAVVTHNSVMLFQMFERGLDVAICAPYIAITEQFGLSFSGMEVKTGTKEQNQKSSASGRITSFHSIPRMLELENIDILAIDEFHVLSNYAGYTKSMLSTFWDTVEELKRRHPHMKIVALTGTPQIMLMANFLDYNIIAIRPKQILSKPKSIYISRSWTKLLKDLDSYMYLYPSRKMGKQQANKYGGLYIDASLKDGSAFREIVKGYMPHPKLFTSTLLSTGISITDPLPNIITNWMPLTEIVQISARARQGGHNLFVTQTHPWYARQGIEPVKLNWTMDFEENMRLLNQYEQWYSYVAHGTDEGTLHDLFYQAIWNPESPLPPVEYLE